MFKNLVIFCLKVFVKSSTWLLYSVGVLACKLQGYTVTRTEIANMMIDHLNEQYKDDEDQETVQLVLGWMH